MSDNKQKYDERLARFMDAVALKEPDRVPCVPTTQTYPYLHAGYSMADIVYSDDKAQDAIKKYQLEYEPDMAFSYGVVFAGLGKMLERSGVKWLQWAGEPGVSIDKNSVHQYLEEDFMKEDEYPDILTNLDGFALRKWIPRSFPAMASLSSVSFSGMMGYGFYAGMMPFVNPEVMQSFETMRDVGQMALDWAMKEGAFEHELEDLGFPLQWGPMTTTAFDVLSDCLRGTIGTMIDVAEQPDNVKAAIEMFYPQTIGAVLAQAPTAVGKTVFIPLHKGLEGFLGPEQYDEFYWPTLRRLIWDIVDAGLIPYVYTEGKYDSRLETIADVPKGKVIMSFEDADMKDAKRILGDHVCIAGGFNNRILEKGTVEETKDEVKRVLDICAPGGGYIFSIRDTLDDCKPENVEAMFETVKEYGKY